MYEINKGAIRSIVLHGIGYNAECPVDIDRFDFCIQMNDVLDAIVDAINQDSTVCSYDRTMNRARAFDTIADIFSKMRVILDVGNNIQ